MENDLRGAVYSGNLTELEGITTKGYASRKKIFIILGRCEQHGTLYGCVIINSRKRLALG